MTKPHLDKASPFLVPQEDYPPSQSVQRNFIAPPFPLFLSPRGSSPVLLYLPSRHCVWSSSVLVGFWSIVLPLSGFPCASAIFPANLPTNTRKKKIIQLPKAHLLQTTHSRGLYSGAIDVVALRPRLCNLPLSIPFHGIHCSTRPSRGRDGL